MERISHLVELYLRNQGQGSAPGLALLPPKIKFEYINLTSFSKMRVDLAVQVRLYLACLLYVSVVPLCIA